MRRKEYFQKKLENSFFQSQMDESNFLEEIRNWEHPPWYRITQFQETVKEIFLENQKGLFLHHLKTHFRMPVKQEMTFGPCQETSKTAITLNPESNFTRRFLSFCIPLKYIDVSRTIPTNLDAMQETRIDDYWNVDGSRDLSDSWTGFTQFTPLSEKPPEGYMWSGGTLTKRQATSRPDHLWPELWRGMARNAKLREKHKWAIEKTKARECWKITRNLFHRPGGQGIQRNHSECSKEIENTKGSSHALQDMQEEQAWWARSKTNDFKFKFACILEASKSTRMPMEESLPKYHEDHIAGKRAQFTVTLQIGTHIYSHASSNEDTAAKAAADKEWEKLEKIPAWDLTKVRSKSEVIDEARTKGVKVHFASLMDICLLKNAELETKAPKIQRSSCAPRRHCQDAQDKQLTQYLLILR